VDNIDTGVHAEAMPASAPVPQKPLEGGAVHICLLSGVMYEHDGVASVRTPASPQRGRRCLCRPQLSDVGVPSGVVLRHISLHVRHRCGRRRRLSVDAGVYVVHS